MARYKAVLFDAFDTLWHGSDSPIAVWRGILADLGADVPTEQIGAAWTREWKVLSHHFGPFESSGHPNEPSEIERMFEASEKRMVKDLVFRSTSEG